MSIMGLSEDGLIVDPIIEKMFSDLYYETHNEDDITLGNFIIYIEEMYKIPVGFLPSLAAPGVSKALTDIAMNIGNLYQTKMDSGKYGVRFEHWEDKKLFVIHGKYPLVIALAIVHDMRISAGKFLNKSGIAH